MATGLSNAAKANVTFNIGNLKKTLDDAADIAITHSLEQIAQLAVEEVESIIRKVFVNDRSGRRRKERTQHLLGSIRAAVTHEGKTAQLVIWSTANPGKVRMLEGGTNKVYRIFPRDAANGFLYFPSNLSQRPVTTGPTARRDTSRRQVAYGSFHRQTGQGKKGTLFTKTIGAQHGPYTGRHFMQRGAKTAIRKALHP